ncbi:MAG: hypothetical protein CMN85_11015 [Spongiibacteraceae bacterium]|uniref:ParB/RepB/Spo0J family partition protein n=1 Tax=uncultured Haliea sp. TaxID=622616 RepID=UPI000C3BF9DE|nr:hypothetical protein [Spongiibacteraceae bacterium]|tara:strand:- start:3234 stop:4868 length:1635 start_codon:yes stop_codon:yes gene_type:complete
MAEQFEYIDIALIDEDVDNHRLVTDKAADEQLQASIQANGVQQPVKVNQKDDGRYTLVFGFRRKANALMAGLSQVPALIVKGLTPKEIRALQAIENLERKELHPLEEARFCEDLAETIRTEHDEQGNGTEFDMVEAISQRIGRSKTWVDKRLAMARLSDRVKQAFMDGDIHLQHAQLIARLAGHEPQEEVLGIVAARECSWLNGRERTESKAPPKTIAETRRAVESRLQDLSAVPWKLDAEFAGKPACSSCPQNSANRMDLFSDDQPKKPQCLQASCYKEKNKLASRAVQKATNTAFKTNEKPTVKHFTAAIAEREVDFVQPKAVAEAAKRRQEPKEKTNGELRGQDSYDRDMKIHSEFGQRHRAWVEEAMQEINKALPLNEPTHIMAMFAIRESGIFDIVDDPDEYSAKEVQVAQKKIRAIFKLLCVTTVDLKKPAREHPAIKISELLKACLVPEDGDEFHRHPLGLSNWSASHFPIDALLETYNIKLEKNRPTREEVENELYPPAPKPKAKPKAKAKPKSATKTKAAPRKKASAKKKEPVPA